MYDWLQDALDDSSCLVTANQRLARDLKRTWGAQQVAAGVSAWRTPDVQPWRQWVGTLVRSAEGRTGLPTCINTHQSRLLWERCLRKELGDSVSGLPALVRLARDTWQQLADWRVSIRELARTAQSQDQRLYAAAAGRYLAVLERERWVDDAGLPALALELLGAGHAVPRSRYVFAGFDRLRPAVTALQEALAASGATVVVQDATQLDRASRVYAFEQRDAELRSAGAWARDVLDGHPGAHVAIVVQGLEQSSQRDLRLVREGFVPGWQYGPESLRDAVNVSYGQRLSEYPAVTLALSVLRWLVADLPAREVAQLLQSPLLGDGDLDGRARLELRLRQMPDRPWAPSMLTSALRGAGDSTDGSDWLGRLAAFSKLRRDLPRYASPADWVLRFDESLRTLGWPGPGSRSSDSYQLVNRWRELLNDFARLDLVSASMNATDAIRQLDQMAAETVFQPETRRAAVQLMGPLEASGAEFDAIWIGGLNANRWPPPGTPSVLVSRGLQRDYGMPDATPKDTRTWAESTLRRLTACAPDVVCSYALVEDDVDQTATDLLGDFTLSDAPADPGWHANRLLQRVTAVAVDDAVPPLGNEKVFGGAGTVQRQMTEPFGAFVHGRLGVRGLDPQALGIPALLRGNLVHDTLFRLYRELPSAAQLRQVGDDELVATVAPAADAALQRYLRNSGPVLLKLLQLEQARMAGVVTAFVKLDRERGEFEVAAVEGTLEFLHANLALKLRFDRIDRYPDGSIAILDYKTGNPQQLLLRDGSVKDHQLFVYASATAEPVSMLALANVNPREPGFSGAGRGFTSEEEWPALLASTRDAIGAACDDLIAGDVRIVADQGAASARDLNVLSRYTELRRDA